MNKNDFEIRTYGKSELAMLYFPDTETSKGALNNLNYYIDNKPGLREALRAIGNPPGAHNYMPNEVELLVHSLGQPYGKKY